MTRRIEFPDGQPDMFELIVENGQFNKSGRVFDLTARTLTEEEAGLELGETLAHAEAVVPNAGPFNRRPDIKLTEFKVPEEDTHLEASAAVLYFAAGLAYPNSKISVPVNGTREWLQSLGLRPRSETLVTKAQDLRFRLIGEYPVLLYKS